MPQQGGTSLTDRSCTNFQSGPPLHWYSCPAGGKWCEHLRWHPPWTLCGLPWDYVNNMVTARSETHAYLIICISHGLQRFILLLAFFILRFKFFNVSRLLLLCGYRAFTPRVRFTLVFQHVNFMNDMALSGCVVGCLSLFLCRRAWRGATNSYHRIIGVNNTIRWPGSTTRAASTSHRDACCLTWEKRMNFMWGWCTGCGSCKGSFIILVKMPFNFWGTIEEGQTKTKDINEVLNCFIAT